MQQIVKSTQFNPTNCFCIEQPNENSLIVDKINPISRSHPVHHGTFSMFSLINFIAVSAVKSSSLHTIILKTKHK